MITTVKVQRAAHLQAAPRMQDVSRQTRLGQYGTLVILTTSILITFLARIHIAFFGFLYFSYVVYIALMLTMVSFALRQLSRRGVAVRELWPIALFAAPIIIGAMRGMYHVREIPEHMLGAWLEVALDERAYIRTFVMEPLFMPLMAVLAASAVASGLHPARLFKPIIVVLWVFGAFVITSVVSAGLTLGELVELAESSRSEFLYDGGLHANVYGMYSAVVYAFLLAYYNHAAIRTSKVFVRTTMAVACCVIFLTFSRSAVIAFALINGFHFWKANLPRKIMLVALVMAITVFLPAEFLDRFQLGTSGGDLNRFSGGRVENIWRPLIPDISKNWLIGQGHYSIYWTDAQQAGAMYPVTHAHNAFLDLLLDYGALGTLLILTFYVYIWRRFNQLSKTDPSPVFQRFFSGAQLAMVGLLLTTLNGRLTPEFTHFPIWIAIGIMAGRMTQATTMVARVTPAVTRQPRGQR